MHCNAEFYYVLEKTYWARVAAAMGGFESYALQRAILLRQRKIRRTGIGCPSKQRRVVLRHRNTVVRGKCTLPSAHLVADEIYA